MVNEFRKAIRTLWTDTCDVYQRHGVDDSSTGLTSDTVEKIASAEPCKLSIGNTGTASDDNAARVTQSITLFIGMEIPAGTRIVVHRGGHDYEYARSGEAVCYPYGDTWQIPLELFRGYA